MGGFFFGRQDVSITFFGRTKEFSEVCVTSLMCNFGVRSRFLDVIYGVCRLTEALDEGGNYQIGLGPYQTKGGWGGGLYIPHFLIGCSNQTAWSGQIHLGCSIKDH